jgi:peptidoglycan-associated lipoprotein
MQRIIRTLTIFTLVLTAVTSCTSKRMLSKANATFDVGEYDRAAVYYRKSLKKVKDRNQRGYVMFRQGECYRLLNFNQFAVNSYRLAITFKYPDTTVFLRYGQVLYNVGRYKDSRDAIDTYLKAFPNSPLGVNYSTALDSVDYWKSAPSRYIVAKERAFDSRRSDFCPVYVGADYDVVYFNSTREGGVSVKNSNITGMRPADFYMTRKDSKNNWTAPELVPGDLNTDYDEGVASVTPDGKAMYFTVCRYENGKAYGASIYRAERTGAQWGKPNIVPVLTDSTSDSLIIAHPAINNGETELYFTSDLPGGFGGKGHLDGEEKRSEMGIARKPRSRNKYSRRRSFPIFAQRGSALFLVERLARNGWARHI